MQIIRITLTINQLLANITSNFWLMSEVDKYVESLMPGLRSPPFNKPDPVMTGDQVVWNTS